MGAVVLVLRWVFLACVGMFLVGRPAVFMYRNWVGSPGCLVLLLISALEVDCWVPLAARDLFWVLWTHYDLVSGFGVVLGSVLRQGLSEPNFYGDDVWVWRDVCLRCARFRRVILRCIGVGCSMGVRAVRLVVDPDAVGDSLVACRRVGPRALWRLFGGSVGAWCSGSGRVRRGPSVDFLSLQRFGCFFLSDPRHCIVSVFVWFLFSRRCCASGLRLFTGMPRKIDLSASPRTLPHPSKSFTDRSKAVLLLWFTISVIVCLHVCPGENFILASFLALRLWCFDCSAVVSGASFFPFDVLDGKCLIIVSIPFYFNFTSA